MKSAREHVVEIITIFYSTTQNLKIIQNECYSDNIMEKVPENGDLNIAESKNV